MLFCLNLGKLVTFTYRPAVLYLKKQNIIGSKFSKVHSIGYTIVLTVIHVMCSNEVWS
jgi:hypothetical protein